MNLEPSGVEASDWKLRNLSWFRSDLTYNLDPAGHIALGFTYKNGNDQDTGVFANSYRIGPKGKI